jgi:hypothetical protein
LVLILNKLLDSGYVVKVLLQRICALRLSFLWILWKSHSAICSQGECWEDVTCEDDSEDGGKDDKKMTPTVLTPFCISTM